MTAFARGILAVAILGGAAASAAPGTIEKVRIAVTRKTGERRTGDLQTRARRVTQSKETETYFVVGLQRMTPDTPEDVALEYLLVIEKAPGRLRPDVRGTETVKLPLGREIEVETDPVTLDTVSWTGGPRGKPRGGTAGESVYGYIVRVRSTDGTLLAEKIQPRDLELKADDLIRAANRQEKRQERARGEPGDGGAAAMPDAGADGGEIGI